ncbi:hypothetical protein S7711_09898 [Stachybotrys chartarum IBT 7711]|uniref:Stress-response A/B barrel domain-containing protein n=1 Tax=Stachybotrys chartarum (strain CBS 109288 / IBT 7711) TaxID=1280523 RepID=A0A084BAU2_STACB|nr:hypothetical protein S7711_09898 [Stachybotrys chartarum IBT 7711]
MARASSIGGATGIIVMVVLSLFLLLQLARPSVSGGDGAGLGRAPVADGVSHLVLFDFKSDIAGDDLHSATSHMLDLANNCLHPSTGKPYIKSIRGGKNNSPEGLSADRTHAFIVEFESLQDRDYYIETDPAHKEFIQHVTPLLDTGAIVVDFQDNDF